MQYQVFVEADVETPHFVASVVGVPNFSVAGATEAEAMANVKSALERKLAAGKFVTIEVDAPVSNNQALVGAGVFADDSTFDDWMEKLAEIRQVANAVDVAE
jgi:predicted RNase H-like HicB family nuclease